MSVRKVTWGGTTTWEAGGETFQSKRDALAAHPNGKPQKIVNGEQRSAWQVDYTDAAGKRHHKAFSKKKDADAYYAEVKTDIAKGVHTPVSKTETVQSAGTSWIKYLEGEGLERASIAGAKQHLKNHINPALGHIKLGQLNSKMITDFRSSLLSSEYREKKLSRLTARKILITMKSILKYARIEAKMMAHNPAEGISVKMDSRSRKRLEVGRDIPTSQEIARLVAAASGKMRPFVLTLIFGGLRASEARGLRWKDVDLTKGVISVVQRADRYGVIGPPKSASSTRKIPVPPIVVSALRELKLSHGQHDLVFCTATGKPDNHSNIFYRMWKPLLAEAGIDKPYTLHSVRHHFCSWLINRREEGGRGLSLKQAQVLMGHSTLAMTSDTYGHLMPSDDDGAELAKAAERLVAIPTSKG
jgi:integrase